VQTATSGAEGLEQLSKQPFDVILSDISMPGMGGLAFLKAVRAVHLDLPVVLMTGSPSLDSAIQAVEYGATQYVLKPVTAKALAEVVWRGVQLHRFASLRRQVEGEMPGTQLGDRASIEARFDLALQGIWIAFQPIVAWSEKSVLGYEALVRTSEASLVRPPDFFDAAERLNRVHDLGRLVRRQIALEVQAAQAGHFRQCSPSGLE